MDREREEVNSSHYVQNRLSLWCPVCGAKENQGCIVVDGLRFASHNAVVTGSIPRPVVEPYVPTWEQKPTGLMPHIKPARKPPFTPRAWVQ